MAVPERLKASPLLLLLFVVLGCSPSPDSSADGGWTTDYGHALERARAEDKMVLLNFTGSDWCMPCLKLRKEILSKEEFKRYARENLILVEVDFPRTKKLPRGTQMQNRELQMRYNIRGFPTIIVLDSEGAKVGELGYMWGGPEAFVGELKKLASKS